MSKDFVQYVMSDLLSGLDDVTARSMFGEYCLYYKGEIFAIVSDGAVYFKAGDANRKRYTSVGSRQYTYETGGKVVPMPYWEVPADVLEDREKIAKWAEESSRTGAGKKNLPSQKILTARV